MLEDYKNIWIFLKPTNFIFIACLKFYLFKIFLS